MPKNGDVNNLFGIYKSRCCKSEILISEGETFPDCSKHPELLTEWKPFLDPVRVLLAGEVRKSRKNDPAA